MFDKLSVNFSKVFATNKNKRHFFFSPGKIKLIGDHVDFFGGNVLSAAVNYGVYAVCAPREDRNVGIFSMNEKAGKKIPIDTIEPSEKLGWFNAAADILKQLREAGLKPRGYDIIIWRNIPPRSGFSSRISLLGLLSLVTEHFSEGEFERIEHARIINRIQKDFLKYEESPIEVFPSLMSKAGHLLLIDTSTLRFRDIPCKNTNFTFLVLTTNVTTTDNAWEELEERKNICAKMLRKAQTMFPKAEKLADLSILDIEETFDIITDIERKRSMHVVTECNRVKEVIMALKNRDFFSLGKNLYSSHISLKNDYNVSCPEIDFIIDASKDISGVIGGKIIGAGFGGSVLILLEKKIVRDYHKQIKEIYIKETGNDLQFYPIEFVDGTKEINQHDIKILQNPPARSSVPPQAAEKGQ